jgi:hypothetical protein
MVLIAERYYRDEPNWSRAELQRHLALPEDLTAAILDALVERGLLARSDDFPHRYVPAKAPGVMTVESVISAFRQGEPSPALDLAPATQAGAAVDRVMGGLDAAMRRELDGVTVKDLLPAPATERRLDLSPR